MTGRELIKKAIQFEKTERVPWVPFVGCHGAKLIGKNADEFLKDAALMLEGAREAVRLYKPDGLPVMFDLQVEAEALGCGLSWSKENPPSVNAHPLHSGKTLSELPSGLDKDAARVKTALEATRMMRDEFPDLALYGLITGPFTLALHLLGSEIFMKMMMDPDGTKELLAYCAEIAKQMAGYYIEAGCDIIAVVDPMTSQIGPDQFNEFLLEYEKGLFDNIRANGAWGSFFVCGNAKQNIEVMCQTGPDNISIDENIPLDYVREVCSKYNISFGGNLQLTVVLLLGTTEDAKQNAISCMELGGDTGFILAPGCDLPFDTPQVNLEAVSLMVHDSYQYNIEKAKAESYTAAKEAAPKLELDYSGDRIIVDIITLDSASCAPCQYMVQAVSEACEVFGDAVEYREHKIKDPHGVAMMQALGVSNLPTICIEGEEAYVSRTPDKNELESAIQKAVNKKKAHV